MTRYVVSNPSPRAILTNDADDPADALLLAQELEGDLSRARFVGSWALAVPTPDGRLVWIEPKDPHDVEAGKELSRVWRGQ